MINVTVGEHKTQEEKPFPKLMKSEKSGAIVFMIRDAAGIVLYGTAAYEAGYYTEEFAMGNFTDFNEPITLQNA